MAVTTLSQTSLLSSADEALLRRRFVEDDPAALPNLLERLPVGTARPVIKYKYDLNGSGRSRLYCAHCHGHRHLRGYVVEVKGRDALIGNNCGQEAFGWVWSDVEAEFKADEDRQYTLRRILAIEPLVPDLLAELSAAKASNFAAAYDTLIHDLRRHFGKLGQELAKAARNDGRLNVEVAVRDHAAEDEKARRDACQLVSAVEFASGPGERQAARNRLKQWKDTHPEYSYEEHMLGRCAGWKMFAAQISPAALLDAAISDVLRAQDQLSQLQSDGSAAGIVDAIQRACEDATLVTDALYQFDAFTSEENLRLIEAWCKGNHSIPHSLVAKGRTLEEQMIADRGRTIGRVTPWTSPAWTSLTRMKAALQRSINDQS